MKHLNLILDFRIMSDDEDYRAVKDDIVDDSASIVEWSADISREEFVAQIKTALSACTQAPEKDLLKSQQAHDYLCLRFHSSYKG